MALIKADQTNGWSTDIEKNDEDDVIYERREEKDTDRKGNLLNNEIMSEHCACVSARKFQTNL